MSVVRLPLLLALVLGPPLLSLLRILSRSGTPDTPVPAGQVLVLGTAQYDGRPSRQLAARLDHAVTRATQLPDARIITVGGSLPGDRFTEAGVGRTYLIERGIAEHRMIAVPDGSDTRGSVTAMVNRVPGATEEHTLVITDPLHSRRAELIVRQEGVPATADPTPSSPTRFPDRAWGLALSHEVGGLLVVDLYRALGRRAADMVEERLRLVQGWLRPSRRARHEQLRRDR
ncbi:YdcF family protein [Corynebacterium halotolerans]|uniref:YdcF family protein n=1 Tax=Corynebacterium halotolerans TaxID=225326 RepID=UPI003CEDD185